MQRDPCHHAVSVGAGYDLARHHRTTRAGVTVHRRSSHLASEADLLLPGVRVHGPIERTGALVAVAVEDVELQGRRTPGQGGNRLFRGESGWAGSTGTVRTRSEGDDQERGLPRRRRLGSLRRRTRTGLGWWRCRRARGGGGGGAWPGAPPTSGQRRRAIRGGLRFFAAWPCAAPRPCKGT